MIRILKLSFVITFLSIFSKSNVSAQFFDDYGVALGTAYANQIWVIKFSSILKETHYKSGLAVGLFAEKEIFKFTSIKGEFGFVQKGFKNLDELTFGDGTIGHVANKNVTLNDLEVQLGFKIKPFQFKLNPYFYGGFSSDFMISYKDIEGVEETSGITYYMYEYLLKDYKKLTFGGFLGFGADLNETYYLEFLYNPSFTNSYESNYFNNYDDCYLVKLGVNLGSL